MVNARPGLDMEREKIGVCKLSPEYLQAFQDVFHLFERSDEVVLDGRKLDDAMKDYDIHLADDEIDEVLGILNNQGDAVDFTAFFSLTSIAAQHLVNRRKDIKPERRIYLALKHFMIKSTECCIKTEHKFPRKSADTLGFYFEGARVLGLSEKQVAERARSIDTTGSSPYRKPLVLPGLPPGDNSKGSSKVASNCTVLPPLLSANDGRRRSKCTILAYATAPRQSIIKSSPKFSLLPWPRDSFSKAATDFTARPKSASRRRVSPHLTIEDKKEQQAMQEKGQLLSDKGSKILKKVTVENKLKSGTGAAAGKPRSRSVNLRIHPLPFKIPIFKQFDKEMVTFEEMSYVRDQIILERENHRKLMRKLAANRIIDAIPLDSFRKQFSNTIKAYFG